MNGEYPTSNDEMKTQATIIWRGIQLVGHEACRLSSDAANWHIDGEAVFSHDQKPSSLSYHITCDERWQTIATQVTGWVGEKRINISIKADRDRRWQLNEVAIPGVTGCVDIDLNFSPSTNLIPIRRLQLKVGESADLVAAWLRFPGFTLEPLIQRYTRLDEHHYCYESGGGSFTADLFVNQDGFVEDYPGIWVAENSSDK